MVSEQLYCMRCGAKNAPESENCVNCGMDLVHPHPIQLDGGEIYLLRCTQCGSRLPVVKITGGVTCVQCGLYHRIVTGNGYVTIIGEPKTEAPVGEGTEATKKFFPEGGITHVRYDEQVDQKTRDLKNQVATLEDALKQEVEKIRKANKKQATTFQVLGICLLIFGGWGTVKWGGGMRSTIGLLFVMVGGVFLLLSGIMTISNKNQTGMYKNNTKSNLEKQIAMINKEISKINDQEVG